MNDMHEFVNTPTPEAVMASQKSLLNRSIEYAKLSVKSKTNEARALALAATVTLLVACGGGGQTEKSIEVPTPEPTKTPPIIITAPRTGEGVVIPLEVSPLEQSMVDNANKKLKQDFQIHEIGKVEPQDSGQGRKGYIYSRELPDGKKITLIKTLTASDDSLQNQFVFLDGINVSDTNGVALPSSSEIANQFNTYFVSETPVTSEIVEAASRKNGNVVVVDIIKEKENGSSALAALIQRNKDNTGSVLQLVACDKTDKDLNFQKGFKGCVGA